MNLNRMIEILKNHPDYPRMGMIACHLGVVRGTSLDGQKVAEIEVTFDQTAITKIVLDIKKMQGIIEVMVDFSEGRLKVGEDIMAVVVAGDTRENVFPALINAVNRIKADGSSKKEYFEMD